MKSKSLSWKSNNLNQNKRKIPKTIQLILFQKNVEHMTDIDEELREITTQKYRINITLVFLSDSKILITPFSVKYDKIFFKTQDGTLDFPFIEEPKTINDGNPLGE